MYKLICIFFLLMCSSVLSQAQTEEYYEDTGDVVVVAPPEEEVKVFYEATDTSMIARDIRISADTIRKLKQQKEFAYIHNLDSLLRASRESAAPPPPASPGTANRLLGSSMIKIILWTLAIIFLGIIIFQLLKTNGLFQKKTVSRVSHIEEIQDEISLNNNFDELIRQAFRQGDYRLAVRYNFLKILQQLRDNELINYEPDKTNSRYVNELPLNLRNDFSRLILQYEYVWYGYFAISQEQYDSMQRGFSSFYKNV